MEDFLKQRLIGVSTLDISSSTDVSDRVEERGMTMFGNSRPDSMTLQDRFFFKLLETFISETYMTNKARQQQTPIGFQEYFKVVTRQTFVALQITHQNKVWAELSSFIHDVWVFTPDYWVVGDI